MAERSDISVDWGIFGRSSPRIIEVASPSTLLKIQDFIDTMRSNTLAAGEPALDNLDDDPVYTQEFDPAGKVPTEPGIQSGIIATMFNAKLRFAARAGPATVLCRATEGTLVAYLRDTGSQTGGDSNTVLIDSAADFINFGIEEKDVDKFTVRNVTDGSSAEVSTVDSGIQITTDGLTGGSDNLFQAGDEIVVEGYALSPIAPSAFTSVSYSTSVSPSIQSLTTMENQIAEIHGQVQREIYIDTSALTNGNGYQQTPYDNWTDAVDEAEANNIKNLVLLADATVDRQINNFVIRGVGDPSIDVNGQVWEKNMLMDLSITGSIGGTDESHYSHCHILTGVTGLSGDLDGCGFAGTVTLRASATTHIIDGYSLVAGLSRPTIDVNGGGCSTSIRDYRGGLILAGADNVADAVTVSMAMGRLQLAASNTDGTISVRGACEFEDLSAGTAVDTGALLEPNQVREVWKILGLDLDDVITITPTGVTTSQGSFVIAFSGDGITSTIMDRTS